MPELTLNEAQVATYAEAMGVEPEDVTAETLAAYHEEQKEKAEAAEKAEREFSEEEKRDLETRVEDAETRAEAAEKKADAAERRFYEDDRDKCIVGAIEEFKIDPAKREEWVARYDENPKLTREFIEELSPDDTLREMHGDDSDGDDGDKLYSAWAGASGVGAPSGGEE